MHSVQPPGIGGRLDSEFDVCNLLSSFLDHFLFSSIPEMSLLRNHCAASLVKQSGLHCARVRFVLRVLTVFWALFALTPRAATAETIDIEYADWGFDERCVPRTFNLLTLGVRNISSEPFEGTLRCHRLLAATASWTGAELTRKVYIAPFSTKVVQFYPYMLDEGEEWEIRWGEGLEDAFVTERPALTSGARVLFNDPLVTSGIKPGLKGFREDWFPITVAATDALRVAVLDHNPRWETIRRNVFRDWLFRGGILHVLQESTGRFPELPIEELNAEPRLKSFGAGKICWHEKTREELDRPYIYETIYSTSEDLVPVVDSSGSSFDIDPTSTEFIRRSEEFYEAYSQWDADRLIPQRLKEFLRPNHDWSTIYLCSMGYLVVLFPGGFLLSKTRFDYRLSFVALLAVVGGFSWLFSVMGARGYGESTSTFSVATARQLPEGRWDVEQWNSLFVTAGGDYSVAADGEYVMVSTVENVERVEGSVENGREARLTVDMPPFTFRTFAHRTQLPLGEFSMVVDRVEYLPATPSEPEEQFSDGRLVRELQPVLQVKTSGLLPSQVRDGLVLYGSSVYRLNRDLLAVGSGELFTGEPMELVELADLGRSFRRFEREEIGDSEKALDRFMLWLVARNLGLRRRMDAHEFQLPVDHARVYIHAELPDQLSCRNAFDPEKPMGSQDGRIVYRIDLHIPSNDQPD